MRNRPREGIAWMQPNADQWAPGSFLGTHNWWHLAMFHLELDDHAEVLRLYDAAIGGTGSSAVLDLIDASAMLWRLALRGVDVGDRWQSLADRWAPLAAAANYAFNDWHAMLAFVGADRAALQRQVLQAQQRAMAEGDDNAGFTRDVGHPACRAVAAFGHGDHATATALLRDIRSHAHRFGGSHAQRDLIDLTLIEASRRGGLDALTSALINERVALRPRTPLAALLRRQEEPLAEAA